MSIQEEQQKKEQIRSAIAGLSEEVLRDALVLSLSGNPSRTDTPEERNLQTESFQDIFDLVTYLKRTYAFPELDLLEIEGGKLLFKDGDRRIVMSEKNYSPVERRETPFAGPRQETSRGGNNHSSPGNDAARFSRLELDD